MLSDVPGLLNPLIHAMVLNQQQQQVGKQQELDKEKLAQETALRKQQLDQQMKQMEIEHEFQQGQLDVAKQHASAEAQEQHLRNVTGVKSLIAQGVHPDIAKSFPDVYKALGGGAESGPTIASAQGNANFITPPGAAPQLPGPSAGQMFPGPAEEAANLAASKGGVAKAEAEAREPSEIRAQTALFGQQKSLAEARAQVDKDLENLRETGANFRAKMQRGTQLTMNENDNKTRLTIAGLGGTPEDSDRINTLKNAYLVGAAKPNLQNPLSALAFQRMQAEGGKDFDPKEALAAKESQNLVPIFDQMEKLADRLPKSKLGVSLTKAGTEAVNATGNLTDLQNEIANLNSKAMQVGRKLEGISGRPLGSQMELELKSMGGIITRDQMLDRVNNLRKQFVTNQNDVLMAGMSPIQKEMIQKYYGLKDVPTGGTVKFKQGNDTWNIPQSEVAGFKNTHPGALEVK